MKSAPSAPPPGATPAPFAGNISFNAQHAPMGAFFSFTCGHFGSAGGIGVEIGKPANQGIFVGVKEGDRRSTAPIRCLPFFRGTGATTAGAAAYDVEHAQPAPSISRSYETYTADRVQRRYCWATDSWSTADFVFNIYTPFGEIPDPAAGDSEAVRAALLPAVLATLVIDNRAGTQTKTGVFGIDFNEAGTRLLGEASGEAGPIGFGWRRSMGVMGVVEEEPGSDGNAISGPLLALQRWSVADGLSDINPVHALGNCGALAIEVPAGQKRTLVLAIGVYLDSIVTTGLEGRYYYTRLYSSLTDVLSSALAQSRRLRQSAAELDAMLLGSGLSADQQFLIAHATRSYYGSTQLLDVGGEPFWIVNEGEYCMMNTLDLSVDQAFWELQHNPWVVRNLLGNFLRHYAYHDQVRDTLKTRSGSFHSGLGAAVNSGLQSASSAARPLGPALPGGISFAHDMGVNNNFSPAGSSSYELSFLNGCFSYMTQEQLCNWIITAACYVARTNDTAWLWAHGHVLAACADSLRARADPQTGVMAYDSSRCAGGQEITTYDSLDESLGQARSNTYLAVKCWASWLGLDLMERMRTAAGGEAAAGEIANAGKWADLLSQHLCKSTTADGTLPAVLESENPGYHSRILPAAEALVYPAYWLHCLRRQPANSNWHADALHTLEEAITGPLAQMLTKHTLTLLSDPRRRNLFADGGIKLSSTSSNSWMSKIALFQHVCRVVLKLTDGPNGAAMAHTFAAADAAHVKWQTDGSGYWACSDQFIDGIAKGSRYYPRIITAALWLQEPQPQEQTAAPAQAVAVGR